MLIAADYAYLSVVFLRSLCSVVCKWMFDASPDTQRWSKELLSRLDMNDLLDHDCHKIGECFFDVLFEMCPIKFERWFLIFQDFEKCFSASRVRNQVAWFTLRRRAVSAGCKGSGSAAWNARWHVNNRRSRWRFRLDRLSSRQFLTLSDV